MYRDNYNNNDRPRRRNSKERIYRDQEGEVFRTVLAGYHLQTGEQHSVLRKVSDGSVWIIPTTELSKRIMVDGEQTYVYTQEFDQEIENERPYQGYTNDPRSRVHNTSRRWDYDERNRYNDR